MWVFFTFFTKNIDYWFLSRSACWDIQQFLRIRGKKCLKILYEHIFHIHAQAYIKVIFSAVSGSAMQ